MTPLAPPRRLFFSKPKRHEAICSGPQVWPKAAALRAAEDALDQRMGAATRRSSLGPWAKASEPSGRMVTIDGGVAVAFVIGQELRLAELKWRRPELLVPKVDTDEGHGRSRE